MRIARSKSPEENKIEDSEPIVSAFKTQLSAAEMAANFNKEQIGQLREAYNHFDVDFD